MLPFLKPKKVAGLIISKRKPDGEGIQEQHSEGEQDHGLEAAAEDMMRAHKSGDSKALAKAMRAAHEIMASQEPSEDEDYDSQNMKAVKFEENE